MLRPVCSSLTLARPAALFRVPSHCAAQSLALPLPSFPPLTMSSIAPVSESARHAAAVTAPLALAAHSTLVNALSVPTVHELVDAKPSSVSVAIRDPAGLAAKRAAMIAGGHSRLQVIADFDRTVSAFRTRNGSMCAASHQLLESCVGFNQTEFLPKMDAINSKYFAIEIDATLSTEVRAAHMMDWWHQAHDLLLEQGIRHSAIEAAVRKAREEGSLELRAGAEVFLRSLNAAEVPCLIFSAGLRDTIDVTLQQESLILPNLHLIGNEMIWSPQPEGLLLKFGEDTITSSNKNYTHVLTQQPAYHQASLQRRNCILLGDNIGDAGMADGLENVGTIIRIGLLHDNVEARLQQFMDAFDVVLLNDASFEWPQQLVDEIIAGVQA